MAPDRRKVEYTTPELTVYGDVDVLTQFAGSGGVDGIIGVDVDGDGDTDTVIGNGS